MVQSHKSCSNSLTTIRACLIHSAKLDIGSRRSQIQAGHPIRPAAELIWNGTEGPMGPQEHKIERRLAAIFAADVAGYSRLMSQDEDATLRSLTELSRDHGPADRRAWRADCQYGGR